jgi:DNA-binding response OmpR family regulator
MPKRILIVDDEPLIALDIQQLLEQESYTVIGLAADNDEASSLIDRDSPEIVVLDAFLHGETAARTAEILRERNIPFLVATGYMRDQLDWIGSEPLVQKPFRPEQLLQAVSSLNPG